VRLALALQVEGKLIGVWLLGRHDPDDIYSPAEITTLQTLARQTALALANIEQATQLQALYQGSIERQEQERMKMAHFLHDAILNQAAVLYTSLDARTLTPQVENAYETLKEQIHQMVSNLRPPSLDFGLGAALEELAEELDQRAQTKFELHLNVQAAEVHYPPHIENHIFRIVQQACENALRHASAHLIQISGILAPNHVELTVEDDGVGFAVGKPLDMASLLANKHFGLVHMMERAEHISAELALESAPGEGTRVHLTWSARELAGD
jgi:two-component system sensor histidine kinase DegS